MPISEAVRIYRISVRAWSSKWRGNQSSCPELWVNEFLRVRMRSAQGTFLTNVQARLGWLLCLPR